MSREWWAEVDTSTFVVCCGDVRASSIFHLFPIDLPVILGDLISHERDFSLFRTSFLVADRPDSEPQSPPTLAIPHSLGFPHGAPSRWILQRNRFDYRRRWFKDFSRPVLQAIVSLDSSSSFFCTEADIPGLKGSESDEELESVARSSGDETLADVESLEVFKFA